LCLCASECGCRDDIVSERVRNNREIEIFWLGCLGLTLALPISQAHAAAELIVNGESESKSLTSSHQFTGPRVND
jgi:hypothetical protein